MLLEAIKYLVEETGSTKWMIELGGYYYEQKKFDLALKYYELADTYGDKWAPQTRKQQIRRQGDTDSRFRQKQAGLHLREGQPDLFQLDGRRETPDRQGHGQGERRVL